MARITRASRYDSLFDVSCYSWELGARKPDPAFFAEAARRIGAHPAAILFIDDSARNVAAALVDTPEGQEGRPSTSLTLEQAVAVIAAARTLPTMELHPGLKDVRRPAELMHAYIVLSLLAGLRTEEARALRDSTWTSTGTRR